MFLLVAPFVLLPQINPAYQFLSISRNGVFLELWEIDTFEGGTNSRAKFLEQMAVDYQNTHKGVYIIVRNLTVEQCTTMLEQGNIPDIVSFGTGAGDMLCAYTQKIDIKTNITNPLLASGQIAGVQYAVPWCVGGYVQCQMTDSCQTYGTGGEYNAQCVVQNVQRYVTQYDAYKAFCEGQFDVLIGTQRDYYRLSNKLNLGVISNCQFLYDNNYTDLVQYLSILSQNEQIKEHAQDYIKYILDDATQSKLSNIGMFGVNGQKIYKGTSIEEFENSVLSIKEVQNAFVSIERIHQLQGIL